MDLVGQDDDASMFHDAAKAVWRLFVYKARSDAFDLQHTRAIVTLLADWLCYYVWLATCSDEFTVDELNLDREMFVPQTNRYLPRFRNMCQFFYNIVSRHSASVSASGSSGDADREFADAITPNWTTEHRYYKVNNATQKAKSIERTRRRNTLYCAWFKLPDYERESFCSAHSALNIAPESAMASALCPILMVVLSKQIPAALLITNVPCFRSLSPPASCLQGFGGGGDNVQQRLENYRAPRPDLAPAHIIAPAPVPASPVLVPVAPLALEMPASVVDHTAEVLRILGGQ